MSQAKCARCGTRVPLEQARHVGTEALCPSCAEAIGVQPPVAAPAGAATSEPRGATQPCGNCRQETLVPDMVTVAGVAVCPKCAHFFRHRPFPVWVKIAAAAVAALTVAGFVANLRFIQGHIEANRAGRAYQAGDIDMAASLMTAAAMHVPECRAHQQEALLLQAIQLLAQDKSEEALPLLRQCAQYGPHKACDYFLADAEAGAAFNRKDYAKFLEHSRVLAKMEPNDDTAALQVASALACKYAVTGEERFKLEALQATEQASGLKHGSRPHFDYYVRRIQHRLNTREIITRKEFDRRFPDQALKEAK